ncbi:MAG TPA: endonuclease/exonuclease/phosphatase family protein [Kofleriaceae bacterium]|nr:endonuclease/exonuclease/phosphatase family protein [Kofleriaceae bacterium]
MSIDRFTFDALEYVEGRWEVVVPAPRTPPVDLRVLTWNVWFGGHMFEERRDALFVELARRRPDVVALQEVTPELLEALLEQPWLRAEWQISTRAVSHYDVAILSRQPIRQLAQIDLPSGMGRNLVLAKLACGLTVATVHLESTAPEAAARAAQLRIIQPALLDHHPDVLLVGDMNFSPDNALETAALDPRFIDVWPALHGAAPGYTMDSDVNLMRQQVKSTPTHRRIDRMFVRSERWRAESIELVGTQAFDLDGTFVSDHFGLEASFRVDP